MGVFTRFKDIVSSNINAMLDNAEDPRKMIRLMIREMEETLVELKANCSQLMATHKKVGRELEAVQNKVELWEERADLAVEKGRDDLAREAIAEKLRHTEKAEALRDEMIQLESLIDQARDDIDKLEEKRNVAVEKQRLLCERHSRAQHCIRARREVRKAGSEDAVLRFEEMEQRIERMEADAELESPPKDRDMEREFRLLEGDGDVERELAELKARKSGKSAPAKKETAAGE
jgi:phage shock protein A